MGGRELEAGSLATSYGVGRRGRLGRASFATGAALIIALIALLTAGCESCAPRRLRRLGSTCGQSSECAGGVCYRGRCTTSCATDGDCAGGICIEAVCQQPADDFDGDGLTNGKEIALKSNPAAADSDGDGTPDLDEVGGGAGKDSNGDGILDVLQSNLKDSDGDCMVDALDVGPANPSLVNLPTAAKLCFVGLCHDHQADAKVVCRKDAPTYDGVVFGCVGCGCELPLSVAPKFQAKETTCDEVDNDCDGLTDEDLAFAGKTKGAPCSGIYGICALPGPDGAVAKGVVECGSDETITCSVHGNGSQSVASAEQCNGLDDDCDAATDEPFSWSNGVQTLPLGAACACGAEKLTCADGSDAQPDVVACAGDGGAATCRRMPFADSAIAVADFGPQPRLRWSAAAPPGWDRIVVAGGAIPGAKAPVARAEAWSLPLAATATAWQPLPDLAIGARDGAAVVADPAADRVIIVGGAGAQGAVEKVYALQKDGVVVDLDALAAGAGRVLPLPDGVAGAPARGAIVGSGVARKLVVFFEGKSALWAPLGGPTPQWVPLALPAPPAGVAALSGTLACLAADASGSGAVVLSLATVGVQAGLARLVDAGDKPAVEWLTSTSPPPARRDVACALDADGKLLVLGGVLPGAASTAALDIATLDAPLIAATKASWLSVGSPDVAATARLGASLLRTPSGLIVVGGYTLSTEAGLQHRRGAREVRRLGQGYATSTAIDLPRPRARIGAATGRWEGHGSCLVGGVTFELADVGAAAARIEPTTDAWCLDDAGQWSQRASGLPAWAFGIGGVDHVSGDVLLAGGVDFGVSPTITGIARIWEAGFDFHEKMAPGDRPQAQPTARRLSLATGKVSELAAPGPELVLSSVTYDARRRRLIAYGGFDDVLPRDGLWVYSFATGQWQDLAKDYLSSQTRPLPGYGVLMGYAPEVDRLLLIGGVLYNYETAKDDWFVSYQFVDGALPIDACHGPNITVTWLVPTLITPSFQTLPTPTYAEPDAKPPAHPIIRLHYGRPALTPLIYDTVAASGVAAVQRVPPYGDKADDGSPCGDPDESRLLVPVRLRLALGVCKGQYLPFFTDEAAPTLPDALVLGATIDAPQLRRHIIVEGVAADGALGGRVHRLDQACVASP